MGAETLDVLDGRGHRLLAGGEAGSHGHRGAFKRWHRRRFLGDFGLGVVRAIDRLVHSFIRGDGWGIEQSPVLLSGKQQQQRHQLRTNTFLTELLI